jgi:hypothetical protein
MGWLRVRRMAGAFPSVLAVCPLLALGACGGSDRAVTEPVQRNIAPAAPDVPDELVTDKDFDRRKFTNPLTIDNQWNPLTPGTRFIYEGRSNRGHGRRPHRVIFTVTDLTKVIDGVRTRVLWDQDINNGELQEAELAFQAQDDDGNVWLLGEYPEEYEDGTISAPSTWLAGLEGARPGVLMRADPRVGTPSYLQGWAPRIEFGDRAKVQSTGVQACVPVGCYRNVLVTDETNPLEPNDGHQRKYYASGVGNIRAAPGPGGKEREVLVLVDVQHLSRQALAKARQEALKLDRRAYRTRRNLYRHTPPAEPLGRPAAEE